VENNITDISGGFLGAIKELTKREMDAESSANQPVDSADSSSSQESDPVIDQAAHKVPDTRQREVVSPPLKFPNVKHAKDQSFDIADTEDDSVSNDTLSEDSIDDSLNEDSSNDSLSEDSSNVSLNADSLEESIVELQHLIKSRLPERNEIDASRENAIPGAGSVSSQPERRLPSYQGEPGSFKQLIADHLDEIDISNVDATSLVEIIRPTIFQNFSNRSIDLICKPDIAIAGPLLETLKYARHKSSIVRLCANLMSTAMNRETARFAHPGFVEIIRNLTSDEARIIDHLNDIRVIPVIDIKRVMVEKQSEMRLNTLVSTIGVDAVCEHHDLAESYLANLERIGIVEIPREVHLTDEHIYDRILNAPPVKEKLDLLNFGGKEYRGEVTKYYAKLSVYGLQFSMSCIGAGAKD